MIVQEWRHHDIAQPEVSRVKLSAESGQENQDFVESSQFFGQKIQGHLNAGCNNLMGHKQVYTDRSVLLNRLSMKAAAQLNDLANRLGMQALQQINRTAMQFQADDEGLEVRDFRMKFGVFYFNGAQQLIAATNNSSARAEQHP